MGIAMPEHSPQSNSLPKSIAISGIVFSILFFVSLAIIRISVPSDPKDSGGWLSDPALRLWIGYALNLIPFTGIAFLWFMAVLRNRIGCFEDQFFSTVFLGSGLLFVASLFAAGSVSRGLLETFSGGEPGTSEAYQVCRAMAFALMNTFGMKMAAAFMIVTSTIGLRTGVLARWVTVMGYLCGIALLLALRELVWIELLFPLWVLVVSTHILLSDSPSAEMP